jgi:hypothetical protein
MLILPPYWPVLVGCSYVTTDVLNEFVNLPPLVRGVHSGLFDPVRRSRRHHKLGSNELIEVLHIEIFRIIMATFS